jgi:hypothetical protein
MSVTRWTTRTCEVLNEMDGDREIRCDEQAVACWYFGVEDGYAQNTTRKLRPTWTSTVSPSSNAG